MSRSRATRRLRPFATCAALLVLLGAASALALPPPFPLQILSRSPDGGDARTGASASSPAVSADGRFVAFTSLGAPVTSDTNDSPDVYVRDRRTGNVVRAIRPPISTCTCGRESNITIGCGPRPPGGASPYSNEAAAIPTP